MYIQPAASLTSASTSFDGTNWQVVVSGNGFAGDSSTVDLFVNGIRQQTDSITSTSATFTVTNALTSTLSNMRLYFPEGTPEAHDSVMGTSLTMTPKLVSITPNSGSIGGTEIIVSAPGLGSRESSTNVDLTVNGTSICLTKRVLAYGQFSCRTLPIEIAAASDVKMTFSGSTIDCSNSDATKCQFEQVTGASFPVVTTQTTTNSSTLTFDGTNFMASLNASAKIAGVPADTVTATSTQVVATWNLGLPPVENGTVDVFFHDDSTKVGYRASGTVNLTNPLSITGSSAALSCSFAGGCLYEVQAAGLSSLLK